MEETGALSGKLCYKWVCHKPSKCEGFIKSAKKSAANQGISTKKRRSHSLEVKEAIVALKYAKIAENNQIFEYASTLERNNPDVPYQLDGDESSDISDSNWRQKIARIILFLFLSTITSKIISSVYKPRKTTNNIDK